jgi:hypothetical protein
MRSRDWRRYQLEKVWKRRIKKFSYQRWYRYTSNGDRKTHPIWTDFIGETCFYFYKTGTTKKWDSRHKTKYSPNKLKSYYRDSRSGRQTLKLREKDKQIVRNIIKEYYEDREFDSE